MQIQLNDKDSKPVNMNSILKAVCNYYSVKSVDVKGKSRTKDLVTPRQIAMYLIKDITKTPLMSIGDFLGGRDHTTVMHGASKIEEELKVSASFRDELNRVKQLIREV
jgi:chromosomal replication initiator protein